MNDELQKALAEFVKATLAGFQAGKDFVLAEAPEVIQQLIRWKFWEAVVWVGIGALMLYVPYRVWPYLWRWCKDDDFENPFPVFGMVACGVSMLLGGIAVFANFERALQIYLAPKVWLIEWALQQVKS